MVIGHFSVVSYLTPREKKIKTKNANRRPIVQKKRNIDLGGHYIYLVSLKQHSGYRSRQVVFELEASSGE